MRWVVAVAFGGAALGLGALGLAAVQAVLSPPDPGEVIAGSLGSSVQLVAEREGGAQRTASGVALGIVGDGKTLIVTAGHFLTPTVQQTVYVKRPSGGARVEATILAVDEAVDLALLEAPGVAAAPVEFQVAARLGDPVWVVSFPWGRRETVVRGTVSQIAADPASAALPLRGPVALIDATVSFGTSGAGVFDARTGRLVGIVRGYRTAKVALPGSQGHALELPIAGETTVVPTTTILCLLAATATGTDATALRALASMRRPAAPPEMRKRADGPSPVPPPEFAGCLTAAPA